VKGHSTVQAAAMASQAPLGGSMAMPREIKVDGGNPDAAAAPLVVVRVVSADYFSTIGTRVIAGRPFQVTDTAKSQPVTILSRTLARHYFKDQSPIGRHLSWKLFNGQWSPQAEVVGVAEDTRSDGITKDPMPTMYQPDTQAGAVSTLLVRTAGPTEQLTPRVVETIRQLDPNRPVDHVQTLEEIRDETIAPQRLNATLIGLFALLALAIATVGVAGVLAFSVSQRTNELGIRMALGAEPGKILRMILAEGATMAAIGLVVGGLCVVPLSRMLTGLLFGVEPVDPPTIATAASVLVGVAIVAAWVPARRAMTVDPMTALRRE
jgi:putative ABC transport system permease protein